MYWRSKVKEGKGDLMPDGHTLTVTFGLGLMFFGMCTLSQKAAIRPTWLSKLKFVLLYGGFALTLSAGALSVASN